MGDQIPYSDLGAASSVEVTRPTGRGTCEVVMPGKKASPKPKEVTSLLLEFEGHPDVDDLKRRFAEVLDVQVGDPNANWHLSGPMVRKRRVLVGGYLLALGAALLVVIPWAWSFASRVIDGNRVTASFLNRFSFTPTPEFSMVLIVLLSAILGSVVVLTLTFADRAGHETLERGYLWWYLTRPISAAGLGLLFYMAFISGFFNAASAKDSQALILAATIGGLAGLFTDQVLKKMSKVLGLMPTSELASGKDSPSKEPV